MNTLLVDRRTQDLVSRYIPSDRQIEDLADFFSALSDNTRIKIISALSISGMCVGDLAAMLDLNQTTVSHQLAYLRRQGVVTFRKQGKVAFYSIRNKAVLDILLTATDLLLS